MKTLVFIPILLLCVAHLFAQDEEELSANIETHLAFADSLETVGSFQGAALVYKTIAELYSRSPEYATALQCLGNLYVNPFNPARNDSVALYWVRKHLEIATLHRSERRRSVILASLIRDRMTRTFSRDRRESTVDSLVSRIRVQEAALIAQEEKIADLTSELYQTDLDLQILLNYQKKPATAKQESAKPAKTPVQKIAAKPPPARKKPELVSATQSEDQLQKLREIDLRALQRRTKR